MNGGTLYDWIQKHGYLTEQEASAVIHDSVTALDFLHSKGWATKTSPVLKSCFKYLQYHSIQ